MSQELTEARVYDCRGALKLGQWFLLIAAVVAITSGLEYNAWQQRTSSQAQGFPLEFLIAAIPMLMLVPLAGDLLSWKNEKVVVDQSRIVWINCLGRCKVSAAIDEIEGFSVAGAQNCFEARLFTKRGTVRIPQTRFRDADDLSRVLSTLCQAADASNGVAAT